MKATSDLFTVRSSTNNGTAKVFECYFADQNDKRIEDFHQIDSWSWLKYHYPHIPACHVTNESDVPVQYRNKLKQKGLVSGVSDLMIMTPSHKGLYLYASIELKRSTKTLSSPVSNEQHEWLMRCAENGGFSCVCYGVKSFRAAMTWYLTGVLPNGYSDSSVIIRN
uniref:VRR-NUC domain-containing protein n=2 Tax=unclassified Caudoviricetes TaxID=2788787 RepID=A0AB39AC73_9CAUD